MHNGNDSETASPDTAEILLADEASTLELAKSLVRHLEPGFRLYLSGDLGSGKTTLARGILRAFGIPGRIKSPTYTLVELYTVSRLNFYHFDFYRFQDPKEWNEAGFREYFDSSGVCIVEWPEKAAGLLPLPDLEIRLEVRPTGRLAHFIAHTASGIDCVSDLKSQGDCS